MQIKYSRMQSKGLDSGLQDMRRQHAPGQLPPSGTRSVLRRTIEQHLHTASSCAFLACRLSSFMLQVIDGQVML
jgi:hypothetical protein